MIISFSGLDGAGKSTHVGAVVEFLRNRGIKTRIIEVYNLSLFSIAGKLLSGVSNRMSHDLVAMQFHREGRISSRKRLLSIARCFSLFVDVLVFLIFVKAPYKIVKKVVICDRYFFDAVIQLYYLRMCSKQFLWWAIRRIPMPDIAFLIMVDPKEAFERKTEYNTSYFVEKDMLYRELARRRSGIKELLSGHLKQMKRDIERMVEAGL